MKTTTLSIEEWQKIVNQYQIFDGTIDQFCQQKHITRSQLYYYKKKIKNQNSDSTEFCQVTLESTKVTKSFPARDVTFNIGLNTITVSATEKELIIALAKELIALC
ncbi:IS66 family insertion sequence element accessory protein TnpA [Intestinibacter bartlettii]|uniref:IS66 family insertion sequence element accessory protein TnpA n=1 Tax=Intestinibacter bartlettii TaxID=261299 RepID=UPI0034A30E4F